MSQLPAGFVLDSGPASLPAGFVLDAEPVDPPRNEFGRQLGLTARHALEGAAGVVGIAADPIGETLSAATGRPYQRLAQSVSSGLDRLGLPQPETATERVVGGASRAIAGGGAFVRGGQVLAQQAQPGLQAAGRFLQQAPRIQAASAVTGGGSAEVAREAGAGPGGQIVAGVLGGLAPGVGATGAQAAVRGGFRGGEAGRQRVEQNVRSFEAAGTTPTVGQATEGRMARSVESLLSRVPGGSGPVVGRATSQAEEIGAGVERAAARLAPTSSAERAGMAVERGVRGPGGFVQTFRANSRALYNEVDQHIPGQTGVDLSQTRRVIGELTTPIAGAAATSQTLANPRLQQLADAINTDLGGSNALPYEAVSRLRTRIGELMTDSSLVTDLPRAQLRRLWGALTEDIQTAAMTNPGALAALQRANRYYRAGMNRLDVIDNVVDRNGGPEAVFGAVTSGTKEGATVLRSVMQSLPHAEQRQVAAAVVRRLGRANPSNQNDLGDTFSVERFLTNWNTMSLEARNTLFNRFGPQFRRDMQRVAEVASNLRQGSRVYANPSGSGQAVVQASTATAAILSFLTGQWAALGAVVGGVTSANVSARLMVNPNFVRWLAQTTRVPASALNQQIVILDNIAKRTGDEEMAEFSAALRQTANTQTSQPAR